MMVIKNKQSVRRYIELICQGRECDNCPIQDLCEKHLGLMLPRDANFRNIEDLFIAIGRNENVDCND
jgi:hypothetical protein